MNESEQQSRQDRALGRFAAIQMIKQALQSGQNMLTAFRSKHLSYVCANLGIRLGRVLEYDPDKEEFVNDAEANRYIDVPMRSPWHL